MNKTIFLSFILLSGCEAKFKVDVDSSSTTPTTQSKALEDIQKYNECMEASGDVQTCSELIAYQQKMRTLDNVLKSIEKNKENDQKDGNDK